MCMFLVFFCWHLDQIYYILVGERIVYWLFMFLISHKNYLVVWTVHKLIDNNVSDLIYVVSIQCSSIMKKKCHYEFITGNIAGILIFWGPECKIRGSGRRKKEPRRKRSDLSREEHFFAEFDTKSHQIAPIIPPLFPRHRRPLRWSC